MGPRATAALPALQPGDKGPAAPCGQRPAGPKAPESLVGGDPVGRVGDRGNLGGSGCMKVDFDEG